MLLLDCQQDLSVVWNGIIGTKVINSIINRVEDLNKEFKDCIKRLL